MMLRAFVGGLALAAGAGLSIGAATAADLPVRVSPPTVPPVAYVQPVYNWSGFYVGGHIGGGFADSSWSDPFTGANNTFNKLGFLGGGQVGANIQFNALVLGVEGDFSWTGRRFDRQHHWHHDQLDLDRYRPGRRRVRSAACLRQGRRRLRPGPEQPDRSRREYRQHDLHAHRLDRRRRP